MTTTMSPTLPLALLPPDRPPTLLAATQAVAERTIAKYLRTPQIIVFGILQSALFLLIFRYVFGGAIGTGGVSYVNFLVPGFIATNILFSNINTTTGVAEDAAAGFTDRLRSLPIPRLSVLAGRNLADVGLLSIVVLVTAVVGVAVGWRPGGSPAELALAFVLCLVYGMALGWLFMVLGLVASNAQAAQGLSMIVFPFTFISSAYVPVATMPGWMQPFARHQPVTAMVDSIRSLCLGDAGKAVMPHSTGHYVVSSLLWCAVIVVVAAPLAIRRFARS
jgi:ABC-2 type transport system permease protein